MGGRSRAELPGAGKQGSEGGRSAKQRESAKSARVGKGFIAGAGLPYKEENTGSAVIGVQGLRVSS